MLNKKVHLSSKTFAKDIKMTPTRNGYGDGLVEVGKKDSNVVVLCCDLTESTRSQSFKDVFPERFIEVGIAEQNMAGLAAGLAMEGKIPFTTSYAVFSPGRNWDQTRVSICYNDANVKTIGAHAGISVGPDGATHQALEDIATVRVLPNMTVVVPCDYLETKKATIAAAKQKGPMYIRFARTATPVFTTTKTPFKIGRAEILTRGKDVSIIGCGPLVHEALLAAKQLRDEGVEAEVINNHTIKPLDEKTLLASTRKTKAVVTVEEHQVMAGAGSAICELLAQKNPVPVELVGMPDSFGESGEPEKLLKKYGMTKQDIIRAVKKVIKRK